jgi:predicted nucleotidyltransferase
MEEKIKQYLADLEQEKGIRILLACETGSRAWGFPSPDSDFDVRFIYMHNKEWYLSLTEKKDTIEFFLDNREVDMSGWDLRKSLRLLWKSNPPMLEKIQSPIIYKVEEDFLKGINSLAQKTYSRIASIHHYMSMAKKSFDEVADHEHFKLKKFFYALRSAVACLWILENEEMPPMELHKMLTGLNIRTGLADRIVELTALKSMSSETYLHSGEQELFEFIKISLERADRDAGSLPSSKAQISELNEFFRKTLDSI